MPQHQTIWTALPNGLKAGAAGTLKLSVFVSPRLGLDGAALGTLEPFRPFHDWPDTLRTSGIAFKVIVDNDEARPIDAAIVTEPKPDSSLWRALFDGATPVRSHHFKPLDAPVSSYPASAVAASVSSGYAALGKKHPYRAPTTADVKTAFPGLAEAFTPEKTEERSPLLVRVAQARARGGTGLDDARRDLADNLLRRDAAVGIEDKLAEAAAVAGQLARSSPTPRFVPLMPKSASPFVQFAAFHRRPSGSPRHAVRAAAGERDDDLIDFHRMLSALGEYPFILRKLGLVFDLEVAAARIPASRFGAPKTLRVVPQLPAAAAGQIQAPVTAYIHEDGSASGSPLPFPLFAAAPRSPARALEIVGGLLNLRIPAPDLVNVLQFDIVKFDLDGAGRKVLNAIDAILGDEERPDGPIDRADEAPLPAVRTSGISLVRSGNAEALAAEHAGASSHEEALQDGKRPSLSAENLVRGYRIDVRRFPPGFRPGIDPEPPWRSLHHRVGTFTFNRPGESDLTLPGIADEGFVQPAMVQEAGASGSLMPVYVHESYCHWQGWSLSAPPPANPLDLATDRPPRPAAAPGLRRLKVEFEPAPGSLPRLRFGSHYQLRARILDLAGNGLTVAEADDVLRRLADQRRPEPFLPLRRAELSGETLKQEDMDFRRYEPISPPVLVPRRELTQAESVDVMVVRSNGPSTTTAAYAASLRDPNYRGFNDRHVVPPKTSERMCETHGVLDGAFGPAGDPSKLFTICRRESGTLNDAFVANLGSGEREALPDFVDRDPATGGETVVRNGIRFVRAPTPPGGGEAANGYTVHFEARLRLPWLPDPMARGAALFHLPGVDNESLELEESTNPGMPGRLVSRRGESQPLPQEAIEALGFLTKIPFKPASEWPELLPFVLRLDGLSPTASSAPSWTEEGGARILTVRLAPAETRTIRISCFPGKDDVALFGLHHWWRRLGAPEGQRHFLNMAQHGALAMLSPARKVTLVHAVQQPVIAPEQGAEAFGVRKFAAGATHVHIAGEFRIHGLSTQKLDLLATWSEPDETADVVHEFQTHVFEVPIHRDVVQPDINIDPVPIAQYVQGTDRLKFLAPDRPELARARRWLARQEFGDTKHRRVTYELVAMTRFREYFPDAITSDSANLTRTTRLEGRIVPSSTRPPGLEISSIIPAFRWEAPDLTQSKRDGGSLRVYLGRRWFATGEGEALAVVGDARAGADPLHASPDVAAPSTIKPLGVRSVTVAGPPALTVHPFAVHFDTEQKLWYADLTFDSRDTYFPFVQLKLARFQEHSLPGMQLSPIVETGFHQLHPNRAVVLELFDDVQGAPGMRKITVAVTGSKAPAASLPSSGRSASYSLEVAVEERDRVQGPDRRDKDLGWTPSQSLRPIADSGLLPPKTLWKGHVLVPALADRQRRIVIKEFEAFARNEGGRDQAWLGEQDGAPARRLVYADAIVIG